MNNDLIGDVRASWFADDSPLSPALVCWRYALAALQRLRRLRRRRPPAGPRRRANGPAGGAEVARLLASAGVGLVAVEATGGYERDAGDARRAAAAAAAAAAVPVSLVNPRQVRDFARALGLLEKTDAIDAEVI